MAQHGEAALPSFGLSPDVAAFAGRLRGAGRVEEVAAVLDETARALGFRFHALVHHGQPMPGQRGALFVQNYPPGWVETYAARGLYRLDPAQRLASQQPGSFAWRDLPRLAGLSQPERRMLAGARSAGLGDGFTVPLHAPGARAASCSFATAPGDPLPTDGLLAAELLAHVAFTALFGLLRPARAGPAPRLTPRQEQCVLLMAQGKTDWEIGAVLGLSEETATAYLKAARGRLGVTSRAQLALAAVSYGLIGFEDIVTWQYPLKEV